MQEASVKAKRSQREQAIEISAYYKWVNDGKIPGHAVSDWTQAEREWEDNHRFLVSMLIFGLIMVVAVTIMVPFFLNKNVVAEYLVLASGLGTGVFVMTFRHNKYRSLFNCLGVGFILLGASPYLSKDDSAMWNFRFLSLGIITLGFAAHAFKSGEYVEQRLNDVSQTMRKWLR